MVLLVFRSRELCHYTKVVIENIKGWFFSCLGVGVTLLDLL